MLLNNPDKKYKSDKTVKYSCQYHVIWTPKYRRHVLINGVDLRLKELILEKQEELKYEVLEMEIMPDHVHLLISSSPKLGIYDTISKIKGYSSKILRDEFPWLKKRIPTLWTRARFISTVGSVSLETVKKYIEEQKGV